MELSGPAAHLPEAGVVRAMHLRRVLERGGLAGEEEPAVNVLCELAVVCCASAARWDGRVAPSRPLVMAPPRDGHANRLWYRALLVVRPQACEHTRKDIVITETFQLHSCLPRNQCSDHVPTCKPPRGHAGSRSRRLASAGNHGPGFRVGHAFVQSLGAT
jgi:hypothetical protein